jgi:hypothetical protein
MERYRSPANTLVAGFFGSPPMNLRPSELRPKKSSKLDRPKSRSTREPSGLPAAGRGDRIPVEADLPAARLYDPDRTCVISLDPKPKRRQTWLHKKTL